MQRITSGDPCPFCEILAAGVRTGSADFPAHDHCSCTAEPIFDASGRQLSRQQAQMQRLWDLVTGGVPDSEQMNVWAAFWREHPLRTSVAFARRVMQAAHGNAARRAAPTSIARRRRTGGRSVAADRPPEGQWLALRQYKRGSDQEINDTLRAGRRPAGRTRQQVDAIDEAMAGSQLRESVVVYRGVRSADAVFGEASAGRNLAGMEWAERSYVSTSSSRQMASRFARRGVVMRVHVPRGVRGVELSGPQYESELMLERGLRMRVVADSGPGSGPPRLLDVEVVP